MFGFSSYDYNYEMDFWLDINGPTHFFSSRHRKYVGYFVGFQKSINPESAVDLRPSFRWAIGKSTFKINWDDPNIGSFEPLEADFVTMSWDGGLDLVLKTGPVYFAAHGGFRLIVQELTIEIDGEPYAGYDLPIALESGFALGLGNEEAGLQAGWRTLHMMEDEIDVEVDDVPFPGVYTSSPREYYLAMIFAN